MLLTPIHSYAEVKACAHYSHQARIIKQYTSSSGTLLFLSSGGKEKAFAYYRGRISASLIPLTVILPGSVPSHLSFTEHSELLNYVQ